MLAVQSRKLLSSVHQFKYSFRNQNLQNIQLASSSYFKVEVANNYSTQSGSEDLKKTKILYDGECSICRVEINLLRKFAKKEHLEYVDITCPSYDPILYNGVTYEDAMKEMHVIEGGKVYLKADAIRKMYDSVGLKWLSNFTRLPIIAPICDKLYVKFAEYRLNRALKHCDTSRCSTKLKALKSEQKKN